MEELQNEKEIFESRTNNKWQLQSSCVDGQFDDAIEPNHAMRCSGEESNPPHLQQQYPQVRYSSSAMGMQQQHHELASVLNQNATEGYFPGSATCTAIQDLLHQLQSRDPIGNFASQRPAPIEYVPIAPNITAQDLLVYKLQLQMQQQHLVAPGDMLHTAGTRASHLGGARTRQTANVNGSESVPLADTQYYQADTGLMQLHVASSGGRVQVTGFQGNTRGTANQHARQESSKRTAQAHADLSQHQHQTRELASRDRVPKKGGRKPSTPLCGGQRTAKQAVIEEESLMAKYNELQRLLTLLLKKIRAQEEKQVQKLMDTIHESNPLILPALIHPEPLKQAKFSPFMSIRMRVARTLLAEFQDKFTKTQGAHQVLNDRYGELPRYLW